jgi:hypothetical protein
MSGISALAPDDVWAVGTDGDPYIGYPPLPVVEHWDGQGWQLIPTPSLRGGGSLSGVVVLSARNVWVVGKAGNEAPLAERWDGRAWHVVRMAEIQGYDELSAVDGVAADDVWAVGNDGGPMINTIDALAKHWNGRNWETVETPTRDDSDLNYESDDYLVAVDVRTKNDAWSVHTSSVRSDLERWNGHTWSITRVFPPVTALTAVVATSSEDAWAAGSKGRGNSIHPLIVHWDGQSWRVQHLSFAGLRASLTGLSALTSSDVWTVGNGLLARYSCSQ